MSALATAEAQVAAVRDDPAAQVFHGPTGRAPRHHPFRRAALSFMRWRLALGRLSPLGRVLGDPRLRARVLELVRDGSPVYAWPFEQRHVWSSPHMPVAARVLERVTRPLS